MTILEQLRKKNTKIIYSVEDGVFQHYGQILSYSLDQTMMTYMEKESDFPEIGNCYIASDEKLEAYELKSWVEENIYANMTTQIGYCNGNNSSVNGFEFHQCSEVFIAVTDCILALIEPHKPLWKDAYQIEDAKLFFVPKDTCIELFPMVGHFAPIRVHEKGFRSIIILSKGTNSPLPHRSQRSNNLISEVDHMKQQAFAINKWLFVHEDRMDLVEKGAYLHVIGDNSPIKVL